MKSTYTYLIIFVSLISIVGCKETVTNQGQSTIETNKATERLHDMINTLGGMEKYHALEDVTFTYIYRDTVRNAQDLSTEKYVYDGELAWSKYTEHTKTLYKNKPGVIIQCWNDKEPWMIEQGEFVTNPQALKMTKFARNTSFFWFNMMFKLVDPGTIHSVLPNRTYKGKDYEIVEINYEDNIGDAQDRMIIYINPETKLVDQFLFVNSFKDETEPRMMEVVSYENHNGITFPSHMRYEPADWDGNILPGEQRAEKFYKNVSFNTGIDKSIFEKPDLTKVSIKDL